MAPHRALRPLRRPLAGAAALALVGALASPTPAGAHTPIQDGRAHPTAARALYVADPDLSQVAYQDMAGQDRFWVAMDLTAGQSVFLQLGTPLLDSLAGYRPGLALVGPGLGDDRLPFPVPHRLGGVTVLPTNSPPGYFDEIFTGTQSSIWVTRDVVVPATGRYYVVAYDPPRVDGKLWLAIGLREQFGLRDIWTYHDTLRFVRGFHEVLDQPLPPLPALLDWLSLVYRWLSPLPPA